MRQNMQLKVWFLVHMETNYAFPGDSYFIKAISLCRPALVGGQNKWPQR